ncbi:U3 small nucleolar RNA-associated protein 6 homolog [Anopheles ziemanni]|uniref:U3 small nucleolar RNA-associated protein 6 homolog n=1 Tax=Anopheles coustani TaxID=139045 RepID=UPI0026585759|nr:U3 small nucleolar RNA-associated protein 6 homolog [Anopheles coustani]XP_058167784.1 U3 small nucleolar RNA-associated protein 6 homolog [Anopheles ziemanni]
MTELIELRREEAIREYEYMQHLKLFTKSEISKIKTKRLYHDYKVERRSKNVTDFINYITYEVNLFHLLLERRKRLPSKTAGYDGLEKSIHKRVRVLYRRAMARFASEYRIWTHFMRYCQMRHFYTDGSRVLNRMLNFHGDKPKAWLSAINWEYRLANNLTSAKHYNLRGLQRHPECRELCLSLIGIQFDEAKALEKSKNSDGLPKALKMAQLVYKNFERKDVEFFQQLLEELKKYRPLSDALAKQAIDTMKTKLADKEEMWDLLANLTLQGSEFVVIADADSKDLLAQCIEIYHEGIARVPSKKMYSLYIESMLKANDSAEGSEKEAKAKRKALARAFKEAFTAEQLEEEKMQQYLKLLLHNPSPKDELVMAIIEKGIQQYPNSADIWSLYLRYLIQKNVELEQLESVFLQATTSVTTNASRITLWKILFQYYHSQSNLSQSVGDLYRKAISQDSEVGQHFQPIYLDHLSKSEGIFVARREYNRLVKNFLTPLELHLKMASLEAMQEHKNIKELRNCYENATQRFGKTNPSIWLEYIMFERDHGQAMLMPALYERAKAMLDDDAFSSFLHEYELLKNPSLED